MPAPLAELDADSHELAEILCADFGDRKVELADVTPQLRALAEVWLRINGADFSFARKMREVIDEQGSLTLRQAKGVLNCARIDILRHLPTPAEPPRCVVCGRPLRDEASIARGAGPSCALRMMASPITAPTQTASRAASFK